MAESGTRVEKTWQQTKSEQTRQAILAAAIDCFYELGYASTTTETSTMALLIHEFRGFRAPYARSRHLPSPSTRRCCFRTRLSR